MRHPSPAMNCRMPDCREFRHCRSPSKISRSWIDLSGCSMDGVGAREPDCYAFRQFPCGVNGTRCGSAMVASGPLDRFSASRIT